VCCCVPFFFSSRRRHTRFDCDWSSDVCSSDLTHSASVAQALAVGAGTICGTNPSKTGAKLINIAGATFDVDHNPTRVKPRNLFRSEERRVGKECRARVARYLYKKKVGDAVKLL